jgi:hypothetical protein
MTKLLSIKTEPRIADYSRSYRHIDVGNDVTLDDLITPGFWGHHANTLQPKDLLDVLSEDMELDVQLRVVETGVGFVTMRVREVFHDRSASNDVSEEIEDDVMPEVPRNMKVGFTPARGYYVQSTHVTPAEIVSSGHENRREAILAAIDYDKKITTKAAA